MLRCGNFREDCLEEVLGEPLTLLVCRLKPGVRTIPRILHNFRLSSARVFAKKHNLGLGLGLVLVHPLQITQVVSVHGKDVIERVEVFDVNLQAERTWEPLLVSQAHGTKRKREGGIFERYCSYLARGVIIVCDAMLLQSLHCALVWLIADMVGTGATAVNLPDQVFVWRLLGDGLEDTLRHGRAADVAEADEQH